MTSAKTTMKHIRAQQVDKKPRASTPQRRRCQVNGLTGGLRVIRELRQRELRSDPVQGPQPRKPACLDAAE